MWLNGNLKDLEGEIRKRVLGIQGRKDKAEHFKEEEHNEECKSN